ncbi:hypothetical protein GCM10027569_69830 [Flindersiella endophytica]
MTGLAGLAGLLCLTGLWAGGSKPAAAGPEPVVESAATTSGRVTDRVVLGDTGSEQAHHVTASGQSAARQGSVEQGALTEPYTARSVVSGGRFTARLRVDERAPLTLQLRELRPNDAWGVAYGFRVYLDGQLQYVRDPADEDAGGGPYNSFFLDTSDAGIIGDGTVEVTVEGAGAEPAYLNEIWAYADLPGLVRAQHLRVPDRVVFVLGQDYLSDQVFRDRIGYVKDNIHSNGSAGVGIAFLDYFTVRTAEQLRRNYQRYLALSRESGLPFAIESTSDWEGTPTRVPDGKGGYFGDVTYQQVLWSPQDQTGPDRDTYVNPGGETQRLQDLLGASYEPRYGLSVPNIWGNTPWLTWRNPDLNAYYARKAGDSLGEIRPLLWDLQRTNEDWRMLAFSTTAESVYWSKRNGAGVADGAYTTYNDGVERRDLFADFNPANVAAASRDGVTLDPADGLSEPEKAWLYKNQSHHQQLFADLFYAGLPRERIEATSGGVEFPADLLRHNVHSEVYSRLQEPYWSGIYPSSAQGVVKHARPGAEYISLNDYSPGGFFHLQKLREFGRLANPNLESSVSGHAPDRTLLLRQAYVNGSRYTSLYNYGTTAAEWVNPYVDDRLPWDVVHDEPADGEVSGKTVVSQTFTAGELRLADRLDVRTRRVGAPAPLRMTIYDSAARERVVAMRSLPAAEVARDGWTSFSFPVEELERGHPYYAEVEQLAGKTASYAFPTAAGDLLYRVGLDLDAERDRSLVIQWRRDASDAIANVAEDLGTGDAFASDPLAAARRALADDRYADAYRLAIRADSLRLPILYQAAAGTVRLSPLPLTLTSAGGADVDVTAVEPELVLTLRAPTSGPAEIVAGDTRVRVDLTGGVPREIRIPWPTMAPARPG